MKPTRDFIVLFSLFCFITLHPNAQGLSGNESDHESLLAIKSQISDDPDSVFTSWNNKSLHFCQWRGVTCGHRHRVVSLDLSSSNLAGTLSPFIGNLSFLRELNLTDNSFQGNIPHQISHLPRLRILSLGENSFEGEIPANLSRCLHLSKLDLGHNKLVGRIPTELSTLPNLLSFRLSYNNLSCRLQDIGIGNMSSSLQQLFLSHNFLQGSIPYDIGRLKSLVSLAIRDNIISGVIPSSLFNLSNLNDLSLSNTNIKGNLPQDIGLRLPKLRNLLISNTYLIGQVPVSLSNLSELVMLDISFNNFKGMLPINGNNSPLLSRIYTQFAFSAVEETRDMSFLDTLTNCTNLQHLLIGGNSLTGTFPHSILNFSNSLELLGLYSNQISGPLPLGLGKFVNVYGLDLHENYFTGPIPDDIGKLETLELFYLYSNNFSEEIPSSVGNLTLLSELDMSYNNLEGSIPKSLGNCVNLGQLYLSYNNLVGSLPIELFLASRLFDLQVDHNKLNGSLPTQISGLKNLVELDVSHNRFSGEVPITLSGCKSLTRLDMSGNSFVGSIPESLSPLKSIEYLDLSCNNLSGEIPSYLSTWPYLISLNLSFNTLEGEVPVNGVFGNMSGLSVVGNSKLCGGLLQLHLPTCHSPSESKPRRLSLPLIIVIIAIVCVIIITLLVALCVYLPCSSRKRKDPSGESQNVKSFLEVSYQMLSRATDGFSPSNLVGGGAFGYVYKGTLIQEDTELPVAVKVMNLQNRRASKSFVAECNALKNIRHRNLVKIITVCSSIDTQRNDFKALVYEFMPRGNLDNWLHSNLVVSGDNQSCSLSLFQRLSIAIDVASALEYLHTGCATPIIHCDMKPSNILLDDEMTAHVGDFGLAKFLSGASTSNDVNQSTSTQVRGTVGYAAPEYGIGSKPSVEGDIYSFGVIVLEMMTSKKPTDPVFSEGLNLNEFAKSTFPDRVMDIVDQRMIDEANMLRKINGVDITKMECIKSLVMVGVQCSLEQPKDRMHINDVVNELKSLRQNLLHIRA